MRKLVSFACVVGCCILLVGCSSKQVVNFKVHTEPEGAHIVYRQDNLSWIYLGTTPLDVIETIPAERTSDSHSVTLRAMRCGYLDQEKEWAGDRLKTEMEEKGMLFWTPRLIKANP